MTNIEYIEGILLQSPSYPSFDAFWDNQIANSYTVCDGPAPVIKDTVEAAAQRKEVVRAALEPKYWP